jgi:hypothetical protein
MEGDNQGLLIIAIIVVFPFAFALILFLVLSILSAVGGWVKVAARFPGPKVVGGLDAQTGSFGLISYRFVLSTKSSPQGLAISVLPFLRFAHKPLFIPWAELRNVRERAGLLGRMVEFDVGEPKLARVRLPKAALADYPGTISGG